MSTRPYIYLFFIVLFFLWERRKRTQGPREKKRRRERKSTERERKEERERDRALKSVREREKRGGLNLDG